MQAEAAYQKSRQDPALAVAEWSLLVDLLTGAVNNVSAASNLVSTVLAFVNSFPFMFALLPSLYLESWLHPEASHGRGAQVLQQHVRNH